MKHTKGPWKAGINYVPYEYDYCWISIPNGPTLSLSPALENEANAHLIAAAPDLLEACKKARNMLMDSGVALIDDLLEAIAKAEGK